MKVRFVTNCVGPGIDYRPGQVIDIPSPSGLIQAGIAIAEGPSPSGTIATLYKNAGYLQVTPAASGYVGPSGVLADVPYQSFYVVDDYTFVVVFPGRLETTLDILKARPRLY